MVLTESQRRSNKIFSTIGKPHIFEEFLGYWDKRPTQTLFNQFSRSYAEFQDSYKSSETLSLLFRLTACLDGFNRSENCPSVCNKIPCRNKAHAYPLSCLEIDSTNNVGSAIGSEKFRPLFSKTYTCECHTGFEWDTQNKACLSAKKPCPVQEICKNGGVCEQSKDGIHCKSKIPPTKHRFKSTC
jgi:hypothetical protein